MRSTVITEWEADAWGTVMLPGDQMYNTLRLQSIQTSFDSIFVMIFGEEVLMSAEESGPDTSYYWLTNGTPHLVMAASLYSESDTVSVSFFMSSTEIVTDAKTLLNRAPVRAYPNPTRDQITFEAEKATGAPLQLQVFDATGRLQETHELTERSFTLPTRHYASGTYFYALTDRDGTARRGKFVVTR
ncbi:T9SS type A sorting domain-containing protein [Catalinimonas alkaloidigena]|nr:T9SS type A sorting domain-containing protein [Catalinimonas alkaloidigena]